MEHMGAWVLLDFSAGPEALGASPIFLLVWAFKGVIWALNSVTSVSIAGDQGELPPSPTHWPLSRES